MLTLAPAAAPAEINFPPEGRAEVRIRRRADGTILLTHIGASYTAPVATMDDAIAKAERIVRMLHAGGPAR